MYVYYGEGMDETTGMAALGDWLAISGHFAGTIYQLPLYPSPNPDLKAQPERPKVN